MEWLIGLGVAHVLTHEVPMLIAAIYAFRKWRKSRNPDTCKHSLRCRDCGTGARRER